jgi:hypothetical protein
MEETPVGKILAGESAISRTLTYAYQQRIHYPGVLYQSGEPMYFKNLYQGWNEEKLMGLHNLGLIAISVTKFEQVAAVRFEVMQKTFEENEKLKQEKADAKGKGEEQKTERKAPSSKANKKNNKKKNRR